MRAAVIGLVFMAGAVACSSSEGSEGGGPGGGAPLTPGVTVTSTASSSSGGTGTSSSSSTGGPAWTGFPACTPQSSSSSSSSSVGTGSSSGNPWECLGHVCWPPPEVPSTTITVRALDYIADTNVEGVTVTLCAENDFDCETPLQTGETDSFGEVTLTLPLAEDHGFAGHIELTAGDRVPTIVHLYPPPTGNTSSWLVGVFTHEQLDLVARLAGADNIKPSRGHVGALVENCAGDGAAGVTFNLESMDVVTSWAYLENNIPNENATATDETGTVGFFNVPTGFTFISATRVAGGVMIGRVPVLVRDGWVTTLVVPPTPL
ncbi:MAG: hypothetical protein AB2A00_18885 [Myxococcota bacterium]